MTGQGKIVVGVDLSPASAEALRWALDEATRRGWSVEAVHAWSYPALTHVPGIVAAPVFAHDDLQSEAMTELDEAVDAVLADLPASNQSVRVDRAVVEGGAALRLVERAGDADLLVVGHRGLGGFRTLLLGSVAHQCAAHAPCPVVIVRPRPDRSATP